MWSHENNPPQFVPPPPPGLDRLRGIEAAAASAAHKASRGIWDDWTALEYAVHHGLPTADDFTARLSCMARDLQKRHYFGHPRRKTGATAPLEDGSIVTVWQYPYAALHYAAYLISRTGGSQ